MRERIKQAVETPMFKQIIGLLVLALGLGITGQALAGSGGGGGKPMDWWAMSQELFGGLAIFLFGMEMMTEALRAVAGDRMKDILAKMTTNPVAGVATGAAVTAVIQSSSVTTVIVVGFVTAGLMNLHQAIGVIFGANIGTTITAQIVAFKVTKYALLMTGAGFLMSILAKKDAIKQYGLMLMGLGLVFYGMHIMGESMKPLRSYEPFLDMMKSMENPIFGILVATAFTGLIQSSSATTSIVIVMASQGLISLPAGIALAFGANIGTTVTALLACIGKTRVAVQAAVAHLLFNVIGVIIWTPFIGQLGDLVITMSPVADKALEGASRMAAEVPRQIANAHTVFNVANTIIFLPFVSKFASLVMRLVPLREETVEQKAMAAMAPKYLDRGLFSTPAVALSMARKESVRLGEIVKDMLSGVPAGVFHGDKAKMAFIRDEDKMVDTLYNQIARYLARLSEHNLSPRHADEAFTSLTTVTELENIGDIIEVHFHHLATVAEHNNVKFDPETIKNLTGYHDKVTQALTTAMVAYEHDRMDAARLVLDMENDIMHGMESLNEELHKRMLSEPRGSGNYAIFALESDIMESYKRIYLHSKRIARLVAHEEGSSSTEAVAMA